MTDVKEAQNKYHLTELSEEAETLLKQQILQINSPDHKVRGLVREFFLFFFFES